MYAYTTTPLLDDFNRPNENPLDGGGNWDNFDARDCQLVSNAVRATGANSSSYWTRFSVSDTEVWADALSTSIQGSLAARIQQPSAIGTWDGYELITGLSNLIQLARITNATPTVLKTAVYSAATFSAGDRVMFRIYGTRLEGWIQHSGVWTLRVTADDGTYADGFIGLITQSTGTSMYDNFGGGQFVPDYIPAPPIVAGYGAC